jgi:cellulose synthase/poly-beta-1,6-N-acetylglucosamine synthase-like glycosyltransferase
MVSILVPVKDEERVVGRLLGALLKLDYPREKMEVVIVEGGSVDETVGVCAEYARRYPDQVRFIRQPASNGKPSALNYALQYVRGEIVAVFDADSVPEPDALMRAVEYFEDSSIAAVQGRTCSINADENMLTKFVSYEEAVRYETYLRGKDSLNLFVPLTGSCYFIRRRVLEEVGGWDDGSLSEDTELSVRLVEGGYGVKYAPEVRSWQENPANLTQLFRQRMRWFRGCMEVSLKYGKLITNFNRRSIDAEVTLAGPYMLALCFMAYLAALCTVLAPIQLDPVFTMMMQVTSLLSIVPLCIIGIALVYVTKPRRVANLLWLPFIYVYWSLQTFLASYALVQILLKRSRRWTKTMKTGAVTNREFV